MELVKRALVALAVLVFIFLMIALVDRGLARAAGAEGGGTTFALPMDCGKTLCVVPGKALEALLMSNDAWAKEAEELRAEVARLKKASDCRAT